MRFIFTCPFYRTNFFFLSIFTEKLKEHFGKFGEIKESMVMKDPTTKRSRFVAFIYSPDVIKRMLIARRIVLDEIPG